MSVQVVKKKKDEITVDGKTYEQLHTEFIEAYNKAQEILKRHGEFKQIIPLLN